MTRPIGETGTPRPGALARRFEAIVFDWDGTAVPDRQSDASDVRSLVERLCAAGVDVAVVSGTHVDNVDGQLRARPEGPGRLLLALNRGSELFEVDEHGPRVVTRREATPEEDAALTRAARDTVERLAARGFEARIVSQRLNRRKIDLLPEPEWADPPKADIDRVVAAAEERLRAAGIDGLAEAVQIAVEAARDAGCAAPKVTSDAKHVEIGLTDKADSARAVFAELWADGISDDQVLIGGDEFGSLGGLVGSDSMMLVAEAEHATVCSVGIEPEGLPDRVVPLPGGPPGVRRAACRPAGATRRRSARHVRPRMVDRRRRHRRCEGTRLRVAARDIRRLDRNHRRTAAGAPRHAPQGHGRGYVRRQRRRVHAPPGATLGTPRRNSAAARPHHARARPSHRRADRTRQGCDEHRVVAIRFARSSRCRVPARDRRSRRRVAAAREAPHGAGDPRRSGLDGNIRYRRIDHRRGLAITHGRTARSSRRVRRGAGEPRPGDAQAALAEATGVGFDGLLVEHRREWSRRWAGADIVIKGDDELQRAVRIAVFHLIASVDPRDEAAVGARGLSGDGYRGHVFWDADTFVLPFFAATHPAAARAMLEYRIRRLPQALARARSEHLLGARFPWESATTGEDVTPTSAVDPHGVVVPIRTGTDELHIVGDVARAACDYVAWTADDDFRRGPGHRLLVETARFWASRIRVDHRGIAHLYGVIGPDEYHEPVDDNAYTNVLARWNLRAAAESVERYGATDLEAGERTHWLDLAGALEDGYRADTGIYEEFAGFFDLDPIRIADIAARPVTADLLLGRERVTRSQIVKQTDVLMLHHLLPDEVAPGSLEANLDFYGPRTAHGSSLSPGIHAPSTRAPGA